MTILGLDLAGDVETVGAKVKRFKEGDEVFAFTGFGFGGNAEYRCLPENDLPRDARVAMKPSSLSYEEAAVLSSGGLTALAYLAAADIEAGDRVLIYGASGSIGTFAIQIAKHLGAVVTGVCGTSNQEMVRSLGADEAIDYTKEDFSVAKGAYDVVFDAVSKASVSACVAALKAGGRYLVSNPSLSHRLRGMLMAMTSRSRMILGVPYPTMEDIVRLGSLAETGTIRPVIDRRFSLEEVPEAHRYVEAGHKKGNAAAAIR